jgi:hypothetical protein
VRVVFARDVGQAIRIPIGSGGPVRRLIYCFRTARNSNIWIRSSPVAESVATL